MSDIDQTTFLSGGNAEFIAELYTRYLDDPASVDESWRRFFAEFGDDAAAFRAERAGPPWSRPLPPIVAPETAVPARSAVDGAAVQRDLQRRPVSLPLRRLDRRPVQPRNHGRLRRRQLLPGARNPKPADGRVPRARLRADARLRSQQPVTHGRAQPGDRILPWRALGHAAVRLVEASRVSPRHQRQGGCRCAGAVPKGRSACRRDPDDRRRAPAHRARGRSWQLRQLRVPRRLRSKAPTALQP